MTELRYGSVSSDKMIVKEEDSLFSADEQMEIEEIDIEPWC